MFCEIDIKEHFPTGVVEKQTHGYHGNAIDFEAPGNGWECAVVVPDCEQIINAKNLAKEYNQLLPKVEVENINEVKFLIKFQPSEFTRSYFKSLVSITNKYDRKVKTSFERVGSTWFVRVYQEL